MNDIELKVVATPEVGLEVGSLAGMIIPQVQSDWDEVDEKKKSFIKNKPKVITSVNQVEADPKGNVDVAVMSNADILEILSR